MEVSTDQNKLFIGGVSWEATEESLTAHFQKYGTVLQAIIAKDRVTGTARGFGFVTFSDSAGLESALNDSHELCGRQVEVKKAIPRSEHQASRQRGFYRFDLPFKTKKIFVGGLSASLTEDGFKNYFEKYGKITDVVVMRDGNGRPRGFGFITFASEDAVEQVLQNNYHTLNDKSVEVKRAVPKDFCYQGTFPPPSPPAGYGAYPTYGLYPTYPYAPVSYPFGGYGYGPYGYGVRPWFSMRGDGPTTLKASAPPFRI